MRTKGSAGCYAVVLLLVLAVFAVAAGPEEAAVKGARAWLGLVDSGRYGESWEQAAAFFRGAVTKEDWERALQGVRAPLGKMLSRKLKSAKYMTSLPGAPDGEYVVIQFESSFEKKKTAVETVTPMKETDGSWRVSGYYIK